MKKKEQPRAERERETGAETNVPTWIDYWANDGSDLGGGRQAQVGLLLPSGKDKQHSWRRAQLETLARNKYNFQMVKTCMLYDIRNKKENLTSNV